MSKCIEVSQSGFVKIYKCQWKWLVSIFLHDAGNNILRRKVCDICRIKNIFLSCEDFTSMSLLQQF